MSERESTEREYLEGLRYEDKFPEEGEDEPNEWTVLGLCPHGVDLHRYFCPQGCRA